MSEPDSRVSVVDVVGTTGIFALAMAPLVLGIALLKLFFRAPLAALLGAVSCAIAYKIGILLYEAMVTDAGNPLGHVAVAGVFYFAGAVLCYILAGSAGFATTLFVWECAIVKNLLRHGGNLGRVLYIAIQLLPTIAICVIIGWQLLQTGPHILQSDLIIILLMCGWFLAAQFAVLRFHRQAHPVGIYATFTGRPSEIARQAEAIEDHCA